MKRLYIVMNWAFFIALVLPLVAQTPLSIDPKQSCTVGGEELEDNLYEFASSKEAEKIIFDIVATIGLKPNFKVKAGNVPNAIATIIDSKRYIIYNEDYIKAVGMSKDQRWSAVFILAHEIGHHLNGHTLSGRSRPDKELEADEFAGFALYKMDASLDEALAVLKLVPEQASSTHPSREARQQAVAVGWIRAREEYVAIEAAAAGKPAADTSEKKTVEKKSFPKVNSVEAKSYKIGKLVQGVLNSMPAMADDGYKLVVQYRDNLFEVPVPNPAEGKPIYDASQNGNFYKVVITFRITGLDTGDYVSYKIVR